MLSDCMSPSRDLSETWRSVLGRLEIEMLAANYETWMRGTTPLRMEDGTVIVQARRAMGLEWLNDPLRCAELQFVSVEKHPFRADELASAHAAWPELSSVAAELHRCWPALVPGFHRLELVERRLTLTLGFGEAAQLLSRIETPVDAFYLDGFSPARNPELWSPEICRSLASLAVPGATLATWSVAGEVRRALTAAKFGLAAVEEAAGGLIAAAFQICHLNGDQIGILGIGDLGLAAKGEVAHGHTVGAVGMGRNRHAPGLVDGAVRGDHIRGGASLRAAHVQFFGRHIQGEQNMFQLANRGFRREDAQDVEAKGGGKLKAGQNQDLVGQSTESATRSLGAWPPHRPRYCGR